MTKTREETVIEQKEIMLGLIENNSSNTQTLKQRILNHQFPDNKSLKPDSISAVIEHIKQNPSKFSPEIANMAEEILIEKRIGKLKYHKVKMTGKKPQGINSGRIVEKIRSGKNSQQREIMQKDAMAPGGQHLSVEEQTFFKSEIIFEYMGSQLANLLMPNSSPKVTLNKDKKTGKVTLLSRFMDDFEQIQIKNNEKEYIEFQKKSKGFGNFFGGNFLIRDNDPSSENTGLTKEGYLVRIDFGGSLSYNELLVDGAGPRQKGKESPTTAEEFKQSMQTIEISKENQTQLYTEEMFQGLDFAHGIYETANNLNLEHVRATVKLSLANLEEAYGKDFLENNDEVIRTFIAKMGLKPPITKKSIEDKIVSNMQNSCVQLKEMAEKEVTRLIDAALTSKDMDSIRAIHDKMPEHVQQYFEKNPANLYDISETKEKPTSLKLSLNLEIKKSQEEITKAANGAIQNLKAKYGENFLQNNIVRLYVTNDFHKIPTENDLRNKLINDITVLQKALPEQQKSQEKTELKENETPKKLKPIQEAIDSNDKINIENLKKEKIGGSSPLKYAIEEKQTDLAIKMVKEGFVLDKTELPAQTKETILKNRSMIEKLFKGISKNDSLRATIVENYGGDKEKLLAKKPSPLYLAIETGQHGLALDMIQQGMTLKKSELHQYRKQHKIKLTIKERLSLSRKYKSKLIANATLNKVILDKRKTPASQAH